MPVAPKFVASETKAINRPLPLIEDLLLVDPALAGLPELSFDTNVVCSVPAQPAIASGPRTSIWLAGAPKFVDAEANATKHPSLLMEGVSLELFPASGVGFVLSFETKLVIPFTLSRIYICWPLMIPVTRLVAFDTNAINCPSLLIAGAVLFDPALAV